MFWKFLCVQALFGCSWRVSTGETPEPKLTPLASSENMLILNPPDCGTSEPAKRIVNGKLAFDMEFPWMVLVKLFFEGHATRCGSSILTQHHLLTAAHCTLLEGSEPIKMDAYYGNVDYKNATRVRVSRFFRHPKFEPKFFLNDISILLLAYPLNYSANARPICIPTKPVNVYNLEVTVAGWGYLSQGGVAEDVLRYTKIKVLPNSRCYKKFKDVGYNKTMMYCAYRVHTDACQGDSGGPLMAQQGDGRIFQVGIVSYGVGCAQDEMPGVYTRLEAFVPWLLQNIGQYAKYKALQ